MAENTQAENTQAQSLQPMTKLWQFYYNAIFGAIGGLIAWLVIGQVDTTAWGVHLANAFTGAGIGFFIGGALGTVEGLLVKRSLVRTVTGVMGGTIAGLISGLLGLLLGGVVFVLIQGGLIARILGWMALGIFLGLGLGVISWQVRRAIYGLVGGALAGLVGGALYELFTQAFLQQSEVAQMFLSAAGLVLIGSSLGIIIPLSISVIGGLMAERGLVVYMNGPRRGMEVELIGAAELGSSDACQVYVPDPSVEKRQALISRNRDARHRAAHDRAPSEKDARRRDSSGSEITRSEITRFEIQNVGSRQSLWVDQAQILPGQSASLPHGAQITLGEIQLRFQQY